MFEPLSTRHLWSYICVDSKDMLILSYRLVPVHIYHHFLSITTFCPSPLLSITYSFPLGMCLSGTTFYPSLLFVHRLICLFFSLRPVPIPITTFFPSPLFVHRDILSIASTLFVRKKTSGCAYPSPLSVLHHFFSLWHSR